MTAGEAKQVEDLFNETCTKRAPKSASYGKKRPRATSSVSRDVKRQRLGGGAERATSATEEHRRRGRKKGSINVKREPYRREEHVDVVSEPDSIISFNTRSMVKRRVELLNAGKLKEGELFQNVEAFSDSNATPSNLDMRFKEVAQSRNSGSVISTPFKRAIGFIRGSDSGRKTPDTEKKRRERRVSNAH